MIRTEGDAVLLDILVVPRASRTKLGPVHDGRLKIAVTAPPVDGKANAAVIAATAKALGVARGSVAVASGHTGRRKTLCITGVVAQRVEALCR